MDEKEKKRKLFLLKLDFFFNKVIPKKHLVWIVATVALFMRLIDGQQWMIISSIYLGVNIIGKFSPNSGQSYKSIEEMNNIPPGPELKP